jgi:hypothetical protein
VALGTAPHHFVDKDWLAVGSSSPAGEVVWVVWQEIDVAPQDPSVFNTETIKAVRCTADLTGCTAPITLSSDSFDFLSNIVIGPTGAPTCPGSTVTV